MKWIFAASSILEVAFKERPFTTAEAFTALKKSAAYRPGTAYRILSDLEKKGRLERLGRGVYRIREKPAENTAPEVPAYVERLANGLAKKGIHGQITGFPVLSNYVNLIPRRVVYLIYVPRGAGESAAGFFEAKNDKVALLNPSYEEIRVALDATKGKDLAVIREMSRSYREEPSVAPIEKAVVDLYFETTRNKIPFTTGEAGRIIADVITSAKIDFKKLLGAASRRGIRNEIKAVLFTLRPELRIDREPVKMNEHAKAILNSARGI